MFPRILRDKPANLRVIEPSSKVRRPNPTIKRLPGKLILGIETPGIRIGIPIRVKFVCCYHIPGSVSDEAGTP